MRIATLHSHVPLNPSQMHVSAGFFQNGYEITGFFGAVAHAGAIRIIAHCVEGRGMATKQRARSCDCVRGNNTRVNPGKECNVWRTGRNRFLQRNQKKTLNP